jgi:hypothetical protein
MSKVFIMPKTNVIYCPMADAIYLMFEGEVNYLGCEYCICLGEF